MSFHPLTGLAAVWASDRGGHAVPVVTVVTDLVNVHAAWRCAGVDLMIAPLAARSGLDRPMTGQMTGMAAAGRRPGRR